MNNADFGWQSLLQTDAPSACPLKAALFTTYDRADERLLAEHLLPLLLKLSREPESEGAERMYFLLELDRRLKQLHDNIVVVSSTSREEQGDNEEGDSGTYGWIWRSIRHLTIGSRGKAVQHSKLWLLHWGAATAHGDEYLEIVVSSANLTRAAFMGQLQAAWRACVKLGRQRSEARLKGWGVLSDFLREIAASADDDTRFAPFIELLAHADCPEGVSFVASVPGTHSSQVLRRKPWGAAGLGDIMPSGRGKVSVGILSPFVGSWSENSLSRWCASFEGSLDRIALVWIDKYHPWAHAGRWVLPDSTLKTLINLDATLLKLRHEPNDSKKTDNFHEKHRPIHGDDRWSHAKVYSFKRGTSRRLLVTSANFSAAAWGRQNDDGELIIENFELGVCVEQATWPFDDLDPFDSTQDAATVPELPSRSSGVITWARAVWDGNKVDVDCRCDASRELAGEVKNGGECAPVTNWKVDADGCLRSAHVPWSDAKRAPLIALLKCDQEAVRVPIFDARLAGDREDALPPGVDKDVAQTMRDELLFEQYGGRVAADAEGDSPIDGDDAMDEERENPGRPDSYSVPAFDLSRRHLGVVDNWADQVKLAAARGMGEFEREVLKRDGELLIEAFKRQADRDANKESAWEIGARLAAEELILRLKHFREA